MTPKRPTIGAFPRRVAEAPGFCELDLPITASYRIKPRYGRIGNRGEADGFILMAGWGSEVSTEMTRDLQSLHVQVQRLPIYQDRVNCLFPTHWDFDGSH